MFAPYLHNGQTHASLPSTGTRHDRDSPTVRKSQAGGYLPECYFDDMAGMVLETSQFSPSTITVSTYPGWALGARLRAVNLSAETITPRNSPCPSWARPQPRAKHQRHQRLAPQRQPSLNRAYSVHPQPQPPLALTPTYVVFGRQVEALRSAETLPARHPPFPRDKMSG